MSRSARGKNSRQLTPSNGRRDVNSEVDNVIHSNSNSREEFRKWQEKQQFQEFLKWKKVKKGGGSTKDDEDAFDKEGDSHQSMVYMQLRELQGRLDKLERENSEIKYKMLHDNYYDTQRQTAYDNFSKKNSFVFLHPEDTGRDYSSEELTLVMLRRFSSRIFISNTQVNVSE